MNKDWLDMEVLEAYLDGKLDAKAMNKVEREALEDPFVAEALHGLSESPKRSLDSISLLQKQLHKRIASHKAVKKESVFTWQRLSIAAAAAVMFMAVSVMFLMRDINGKKELAGSHKKVEVTVAPAGPAAPPASQTVPVVVPETADGKNLEEIDKATRVTKASAYATNLKTKSAVKQPFTSIQQRDDLAAGKSGVLQVGNITNAVSSVRTIELANVLSGKVVSQDDGKPLPGVSVALDGTNLTAVTDGNGDFKIYADTSVKGGKIHASYIGFNGAEALAKVNEPISIALKPGHTALNEIAVVGYGKVREAEKNAPLQIRGISSAAKKQVAMVSNPIGGWDMLFEFINSNNAFAKEKKSGQTVELSFQIDDKGSPTHIKIVTGADGKYEQEAIRLISNGPRWEKPMSANSRMTFKIDF